MSTIDVKTSADQYGAVITDVTVDGRRASVAFADGEVTLSVSATAGDITFQVPFSMVPQEVTG